jgi:ankyrin repeat protein
VRDVDADEQVRAVLLEAFECARNADTPRLAELLDLGVPVNLTNDRGDTLLILAAYHRQPEAVNLLLARGADVDRANDNGQTALGAAAFRQDVAVVNALLGAGANPDSGARSARMVTQFFGLDTIAALLPPAAATA